MYAINCVSKSLVYRKFIAMEQLVVTVCPFKLDQSQQQAAS